MPFDQSTRNRLQQFVADARTLLTEEFTRQLQNEYGLDPATGNVSDLEKLAHLDDTHRETARLLRVTMEHYLASDPGVDVGETLQRIVREQAFTILNRLCALRMAEARGLLIESVSTGYNSKGCKLYSRLAGPALGETGEAYRCYLFSLFDEYAVDLAALFDRYSPMGRLFPREAALLGMLGLINADELATLWGEDETIGWIYQYFNSKDERKAMRDASAAPRNSRELAVRNQFFTPRYVVEFLTDNTLGRIWYEMRQGETTLAEKCRYLVRRPVEVYLSQRHLNTWPDVHEGIRAAAEGNFADLPETPSQEDWQALALLISNVKGGSPSGLTECEVFYLAEQETFRRTGHWSGDAVTLWYALFHLQRKYRWLEQKPEGEEWDELVSLYQALRQRLQEDVTGLSQEDLLKRPVFISPRKPKDPRELKILDPACGSGHFLLYTFDLLEEIYREAWENGDDITSTATGRTLRQDYPTLDELLLATPALILEHNLHGIDIDPRAVQIAGLSLWLRAQRAWHEKGIKSASRPSIRRSNLVCAEPMPGEADLLKEFKETLKPRVLGQLVETIFEKMELAGEAGSLLKIEDEIIGAIDEAREAFNKEILRRKQEKSFLPGMTPSAQMSLFDFADLPSKTQFWNTAEEQILDALRRYAEYASGGEASRRRLFADDAAKGFAFIDLCRKRYDVVLMNPPFGEFVTGIKSVAKEAFPNSYNDIFAAFTERWFDRLNLLGFLGAITSRTGFFLTSFSRWRQDFVLKAASLECLADLGLGVMDDAMVEAATYVFGKRNPLDILPCIRVLSDKDKAHGLLSTIRFASSGKITDSLFWSDQQQFLMLSGAPFVYWVTRSILSNLAKCAQICPEVIEVRQGLATADDPRFARAIWEVPPHLLWQADHLDKTWVPYIKGGASQPFFAPITLVVNWRNDAEELWANHNTKGQIRSNIWMLKEAIASYFFRPGFSWTRRAVRFIPYIVPAGCIPSASRYMAYPARGKENAAMGVTASNLATAYLRFFGERFLHPNYMVEVVKTLPWVALPQSTLKKVEQTVKAGVAIRRKKFQQEEPYQEFIVPAGIPVAETIETPQFDHYSLLGVDLDIEVAHAYGLNISDIASLYRDFQEAVNAQRNNVEESDLEADDEQEEALLSGEEPTDNTEGLISYFVGCALGRWDIRLSTGERQPQELPDPFGPLPVCPPGMLQGPDGLPAKPEDVPSDYPIRIYWDGILVDDPGHEDDIIHRVQGVLEVIWKDYAEAIEREACEILGVKSLREYFAKPGLFFTDHLKRYSKSRRQAPIYWPLSAASGSYTLWIYYHRLTDQTLYTCVNDFIEPKLKSIAEAAESLRRRSGRSRTEEKELERLVDLEHELGDFRDELLRVAAFWKPNLNDGVQITAAPLWRLFRLPKWQKTLKETWQKLEKGNYDWAHLAFSIWPDRVREKCKADKSLAIAHGLEDMYIEPPAGKGKKRGRPKPADEEERFDEDQ